MARIALGQSLAKAAQSTNNNDKALLRSSYEEFPQMLAECYSELVGIRSDGRTA